MPSARLTFRVLVSLTAAAILGRTVWVASRTEGGYSMVADHLIAGLPPPMHYVDFNRPRPGVQLCQWLVSEGQRVASDPKSAAADLMGAAMLLGTMYRDQQMHDPRQAGLALWSAHLRGDGDIEPADDPFIRAFELSLALARKATELEPDQKDWWRLRALMMFHLSKFNGVREYPIDAAVLQSAEVHDPTNSLYEYLMGLDCFLRAEVRKSQGGPLSVGHPELFIECEPHYAAALSKPILATGKNSDDCIAIFLANAFGPNEFKLSATRNMSMDGLRAMAINGNPNPMHHLEDPLNGPGAAAILKLEPEDEVHKVAIWLVEQDLDTKWIDQWHASGESGGLLEMLAAQCRLRAPGGSPAESPAAWMKNQQYINAIINVSGAEQSADQRHESLKIWSEIAVAAAAIGWLMLIVGAIGIVAMRFVVARSRSDVARSPDRATASTEGFQSTTASPKPLAIRTALRPLWCILLWLAIFGLTFAFYGILPAYEHPLHPYHWWFAAVGAVIVLVPTGILIWLAARFVFRQGRLPRAERSIYFQPMRWGSSITVALLFAAIPFAFAEPNMRAWIFSLAQGFPESIIENRGLIGNGNAASALSGRLDINQWYSPTWAIVQWGVHGGLFWTTGIWLAIMLLLNPTREGCRRTSKFAIAFGILMLFIALAAATQWTEIVRTRFQREFAHLADPTWLNRAVDAEVQRIETNGG